MATEMVSREMTCPHCEGTTRMLNHFDPLKLQRPGEYVIDRKERSPSGREMYNYKCNECVSGRVTVYGVVEFPNI